MIKYFILILIKKLFLDKKGEDVMYVCCVCVCQACRVRKDVSQSMLSLSFVQSHII